jgi:hypothetical protein
MYVRCPCVAAVERAAAAAAASDDLVSEKGLEAMARLAERVGRLDEEVGEASKDLAWLEERRERLVGGGDEGSPLSSRTLVDSRVGSRPGSSCVRRDR